MSAPSGAPLWYLGRAKFRGRVRGLLRRSGTLLGVFLFVVGLLLVGGWIFSLVYRASLLEGRGAPPSTEFVQVGLAAYLLFAAIMSLSVRGVYLPKPELERLLASPTRRSSIVRYRMATNLFLTLPLSVFLGIFVAPRFESIAVVGIVLSIGVLQSVIVAQAVSLLAAPTSGVLNRILERLPSGAPRVVGLLGALSFLHWGGPSANDGLGGGSPIDRFVMHEWMQAGTLPLRPWAIAFTAPSLALAAPWIALITAILVVSFEAVARMPIDFRESAIRSSEASERRLARLRRGQGSVSAFGPSVPTRSVRIPAVFGRGPVGALLWLRHVWLVRQARGTLLIIALGGILGFQLGTSVLDGTGSQTATLAVLGVVYLTGGLRADFRTDLDRMEAIRAWPLHPRTVFFATVLPVALVASVVVAVVLIARALVLEHPASDVGVILAGVLPASYAWAAVDNAIFLLLPTRFVPGSGSALQNAGRSFMLVLLRGVLLLLYLALAGGGAALLERALGGTFSEEQALAIAIGWSVLVGGAGLWALSVFGGWALARYDVSRTPPAH